MASNSAVTLLVTAGDRLHAAGDGCGEDASVEPLHQPAAEEVHHRRGGTSDGRRRR